jgi:putative Holliday junction resolvase
MSFIPLTARSFTGFGLFALSGDGLPGAYRPRDGPGQALRTLPPAQARLALLPGAGQNRASIVNPEDLAKLSGRVLALDPGRVRVGVAISDEDRVLASPRDALDGGDFKRLVALIVELCREEEVKRVLVGWPLDLSGEAGPPARKAEALAKAVEEASGIPVELVDERLSTVAAHRRLDDAGKKKGKARARAIDGAAAALLLQAWLDARR